MENKTAIEWLEQNLTDTVLMSRSQLAFIIATSKEMERKQKDVDYQNGYLDCYAKLMSERLTRDI